MMRLRLWTRRLGLAFSIALTLIALGAEYAIRTAPLPLPLEEPLTGTPLFLDRKGDLIAEWPSGTARTHIPLEAEEFGPWLPSVTIALEDHRFESHFGIDPHGIAGAALHNFKRRGISRGASTLTQQLVKQASARQGRTWGPKLRELPQALRLERNLDKSAILVAYLNRLDYGNRRIGPESAARAYFNKACSRLTLGEAIFLAGLPQAPSRFNPWYRPELALAKYERSLRRLRQLDYITLEQERQLRLHPPRPAQHVPENRWEHFIHAAQQAHGKDFPGGLIRTTLDPSIQLIAQRLLEGHLNGLNRYDIRNGSVVVLENQTASVLALVNAHSRQAPEESEMNAALIQRHAGSTLKPFIYEHAIEARVITAATVLPDTQDALRKIYTDYDPQNFNQRFHGPVRARQALASSLNIPAILVAHRTGARGAFERLSEWGLHPVEDFNQTGVGFVLGNLRVSLLDLCVAYSNLARGGIATKQARFLEEDVPTLDAIADPKAVAIIEDILCDNEARSLAFGGASILNFGPDERTAVKTGTSSSFRDAWVIGYNRDFTVGVWVGNLNGRSIDAALTVQTAGPVWRQTMRYLTRHHGARPLLPIKEKNFSLTSVDICRISGLLPAPGFSVTQREWFLPGTEPTQDASSFFADLGGSGPRILLPSEYRGWVQSKSNHLHAGLQETTLHPGASFSITSPTPGGRYVIDPALPAAQQRLVFRSDHVAPENLRWQIDDEVFDGVPPPWPLKPGQWNLKAIDLTTGEEVQIQFSVDP